jgi:hypothetical protein
VALKTVSDGGAATFANFVLASTVPATVPAAWNVADKLTNASPSAAGNTKIHPAPWTLQSWGDPCGKLVPIFPT